MNEIIVSAIVAVIVSYVVVTAVTEKEIKKIDKQYKEFCESIILNLKDKS